MASHRSAAETLGNRANGGERGGERGGLIFESMLMTLFEERRRAPAVLRWT